MIEPARLRWLADRENPAGRYVLYWMQRAQRVAGNHALALAIVEANRLSLPVVVGFGLMDDYPEANERHYAFMLEGLAEVAVELGRRSIGFVLRHGSPDRVAVDLAAQAALLVCDRGHLRHEKAWRANVAAAVSCPVVEVETDTVVPVDSVSDKAETAARTIRPKIMRRINEFLRPVASIAPAHASLAIAPAGDFEARDVAGTLRRLHLDRSVAPVAALKGGAAAARRQVGEFVTRYLARYAAERSEPASGVASRLSPYLHFGQISPLEVALRVREVGDAENASVFLEELIVRRELAINFVNFTPDYDRYAALPGWARRTLEAHASDKRPALYDDAQLAAAATADPYWNAAMTEMIVTGAMPNHMRMYWGKKVLEWTAEPAAAYRRLLALNNRYFLDGRDANSFANVGWIFGLHDRPWPERPVFGTVRAMTAAGLERKLDIAAYVERVGKLGQSQHPPEALDKPPPGP